MYIYAKEKRDPCEHYDISYMVNAPSQSASTHSHTCTLSNMRDP